MAVATEQDLVSLKIHTHQGVVWYQDGDQPCRCAHTPAAEFVRSPVFRGAGTLRLVGCLSNVELILAAAKHKQEGQLMSVQLVTPLICHTSEARQCPEHVLFHMRLFHYAPSLGGFHELTDKDLPSYRLADQIAKGQPLNTVLATLHSHPAWPALRFVTSLNEAATALLLAQILDPRWFISLDRPDRTAKLESYLGLNPQTQASLTNGKIRGFNQHRCRQALTCWKNSDYEEKVRQTYAVTAPHVVAGLAQPGLLPGDFIWRAWAEYAGYSVHPDARLPNVVLADLRGSQRFVRFLRNTWLAALGREKPWTPLFRPADFFGTEIESQAYSRLQLIGSAPR